MDNIGKKDFLLGIQTQFQRDMTVKYGPSCVCIDSTHGTNMYDFVLVTVLVIDDFGEGIPVAWAVSNREDATLLVQFFQAIKQRTCSIQTKWFMTSDAQQYYNTWSGAFGNTSTRKLLCAWHVDRAWRGALNELVSSKQIRVEIYHHLRVILMQDDEKEFQFLLQQLISYLDDCEPLFTNYFRKNYCNPS